MEQHSILCKVEAVKNETVENQAQIEWIKHKLNETNRNFILDSINSKKILSVQP